MVCKDMLWKKLTLCISVFCHTCKCAYQLRVALNMIKSSASIKSLLITYTVLHNNILLRTSCTNVITLFNNEKIVLQFEIQVQLLVPVTMWSVLFFFMDQLVWLFSKSSMKSWYFMSVLQARPGCFSYLFWFWVVNHLPALQPMVNNSWVSIPVLCVLLR